MIAPASDQLASLIEQFPPEEYHAVLEEALFAFEHQSLFNVMDYATGWRIGFIIAKPTAFGAAEFSRRREIDVAGARIYVASPEDVVIAKLDWAGPRQRLCPTHGLAHFDCSRLPRGGRHHLAFHSAG